MNGAAVMAANLIAVPKHPLIQVVPTASEQLRRGSPYDGRGCRRANTCNRMQSTQCCAKLLAIAAICKACAPMCSLPSSDEAPAVDSTISMTRKVVHTPRQLSISAGLRWSCKLQRSRPSRPCTHGGMSTPRSCCRSQTGRCTSGHIRNGCSCACQESIRKQTRTAFPMFANWGQKASRSYMSHSVGIKPHLQLQ
jgi:hypothetical protein